MVQVIWFLLPSRNGDNQRYSWGPLASLVNGPNSWRESVDLLLSSGNKTIPNVGDIFNKNKWWYSHNQRHWGQGPWSDSCSREVLWDMTLLPIQQNLPAWQESRQPPVYYSLTALSGGRRPAFLPSLNSLCYLPMFFTGVSTKPKDSPRQK